MFTNEGCAIDSARCWPLVFAVFAIECVRNDAGGVTLLSVYLWVSHYVESMLDAKVYCSCGFGVGWNCGSG